LILEKDIENKFVEWVESQGGKAMKWTGSREKFDRIIMTHTAQLFLLEFKKPGGELTAHQFDLLDEMREIANKAALDLGRLIQLPVYVVDSFEGAVKHYDRVASCTLWR